MFKKVLSLLLTLVVMAGICSTAVFAAVPQLGTDTDTDGETVIGHLYEDKFDLDEDVTLKSGYPGSATNVSGGYVNLKSDVFTDGQTNVSVAIDADGGADGKGALILKNKNASYDAIINVRNDFISDLAVGDYAVFKYDVKFAALANEVNGGYTNTINLSGAGVNSGGYTLGIKKEAGQDAHFYKIVPSVSSSVTTEIVDTTKWYTVVNELVPAVLTRKDDGSIDTVSAKRIASIIDDTGRVIASSSCTVTVSYLLKFYSPIINSGAYGSELHIDNASLSIYDMKKYAPELTNTPSIENKTVGLGAQTVRVSFDQPIASASAFVKNLTDTSAADITCTVTAATDALWSYDITIPAGTLSADTQYSMDLSGFKNNGGTASAETILFSSQKTTAVDYSQSADFSISQATGSTYSDVTWTVGGSTERRRGFSNYPLLYFGAESTGIAAENGVAEIKDGAGWGHISGGVKIRTTETLTRSEGATHVLTYRMKIGEKSGVNPLLKIGFFHHSDNKHPGEVGLLSSGIIAEFTTMTNAESGETELVIRNSGSSDTAPWQTNTWYDIIYTVDYDGHEIKIYNSETNQFVYSMRETFIDDFPTPTSYGFMLAEMAASNFVPISLDDVTQWKLDSTKEWSQPRYVSNTEAEEISGSADVNMTLAFDQPMITEAGQYMVLDENDRFAGEVSVIQEDFCKQKLLLAGLDYGQSYTLIYNGVENLIGQALYGANDKECVPDITFTTGNDETNAFAVQGEAVVSGLTENSTITFDLYSRDGGAVKLLCTLYDTQGNLLGVAMADAAGVAAGTVTSQTITLTQDYSTARKIKIFGWNNLTKLQPLMEAETLTAPRENVSVLMIGNSLSEDMIRNIDSVAKAGDLNISLTAKLCGGASLSDHAANLKAEIEEDRTVEQANAQAEEIKATGGTARLLYFNQGNAAMSDKLLSTALKGDRKYDIVSIQPYGTASGELEAMKTIVGYVKQYQPQAEIVLYQPWSNYAGAKTTRNASFAAIAEHTEALLAYAGDMTVVPSGYAFKLAYNQDEETYGAKCYDAADSNTDAGEQAGGTEAVEFANSTGLWRDISHGSYYGCYLTDAVWYEVLTGKRAPIENSEGAAVVAAPDGVDSETHLAKLEFLSQMAHRAVAAYK